MRNVTVSKDIAAPQADVWAVLSDFPNIADWNKGVKASRAAGDAVEGVGAMRICEFAPVGAVEESVAEWEPPHRLVVSIDKTIKMPFTHGKATFTLGDGSAATPTVASIDFDPKGGVLSGIVTAIVRRRLTKGFTGFLDDLETAAQARSTT